MVGKRSRIWAVLAPGGSLTPEVVTQACDGVRGVVAVSNAYQLAPFADALVSGDSAWWHANPEALKFRGLKYSAGLVKGVTRLGHMAGKNSGLMGVKVAVMLGATHIHLHGFDMHGTHFFGSHPEPLKDPTEASFQRFRGQFAKYKPRGVVILNCTPGSKLTCYPFAVL